MLSGQASTSSPVMLLATCPALGTSPALWPGAPQGLTIGLLHLFTTLPKGAHHLGARSRRLPSARCIFRALQYHSAPSGSWCWSQPRGWSLKRSYTGNHISIPFPSSSSPTEPPSAGGKHTVPCPQPGSRVSPTSTRRPTSPGAINPCPRAGTCCVAFFCGAGWKSCR